MEAQQGDSSAVRYLFKRGLEASPRSRYLYLAWATWEEKQGKRTFARSLLERGHLLNRRDPAILQVASLPRPATSHQNDNGTVPPCCYGSASFAVLQSPSATNNINVRLVL